MLFLHLHILPQFFVPSSGLFWCDLSGLDPGVHHSKWHHYERNLLGNITRKHISFSISFFGFLSTSLSILWPLNNSNYSLLNSLNCFKIAAWAPLEGELAWPAEPSRAAAIYLFRRRAGGGTAQTSWWTGKVFQRLALRSLSQALGLALCSSSAPLYAGRQTSRGASGCHPQHHALVPEGTSPRSLTRTPSSAAG